jgi:hypothetical protein
MGDAKSKDKRRRILDAQKGGSCAGCGRKLLDGEPVWRKRISLGYGFMGGWRTTVAPFCEECRDSYRGYFWNGRCDSCGRVVYESEFRSNRSHHYCCDTCRRRHQSAHGAAVGRECRAKARGPSRPCIVCGEHFETGRNDARYCSPGCRQKAYRRRVTDNELSLQTDNSLAVT